MGEKIDEKFDIIVIGAGPGGYVAAIKASQHGKRVALIEKEAMGGTCLNRGCIPTKTLLANAEVVEKIKKAEKYGIETGPVSFKYDKMKDRKDGVVSKIRSSLEGLIKSNGITILRGTAQFTSQNELKILGENSGTYSFEKAIIATGSESLDVPSFPCDHKKILNSTSVLELTELPKSIAIIGGGYIGCEFASLFNALGVEVTIVEALPSIISMMSKEISSHLSNVFTKAGIKLVTGAFVQKIDTQGDGVVLDLGENKTLAADIALVSVGRTLNSKGIGLEKAGVKISDKGAIEVNSKMETNVPGIYAIGDVTGIALLAHVASHQGIIAAENACGGTGFMHYHAVPAVIFTMPEIATVGMTMEEATEEGYAATIGKFPFMALGKAQATLDTEGFAQVVTDKKTGQVLGAQVVGKDAATMIAEMALAINNELTLDCVTETIHAHPTLAEAWLEAALIAGDTPIHFPPKIKR